MVFQHPETAPQQWDIGEYKALDLSGTRVRYSVSTAHGSSGGATVDTDGQLFALHNAEVQTSTGQAAASPRLNQGIRIDHIAKDVAAAKPGVLPPLPALDETHLFWSLNDDLQNPMPIIGRATFRERALSMMVPEAPRVLVVTGPAASGLNYSTKLLRRTLGAHVPVVDFSAAELQALQPADFLKRLCEDLRISLLDAEPMPTPKPTETLARWLRVDLPAWLMNLLVLHEQRDRSRYPAWVTINTATWTSDKKPDRLVWAAYLNELIAALVGVHDPGQTAIDVPQLRWLFIAPAVDMLPLSGVAQVEDDLSASNFETGFAECVQSAWFSIDRNPAGQNLPLIEGVANGIRQMHSAYPDPSKALLKRFAEWVCVIIKKEAQNLG